MMWSLLILQQGKNRKWEKTLAQTVPPSLRNSSDRFLFSIVSMRRGTDTENSRPISWEIYIAVGVEEVFMKPDGKVKTAKRGKSGNFWD